MSEAGDVGGAVGSFAVTNGDLDDFEIEFIGTKNKVEIAEGVEVAEELTVSDKAFVVGSEHHFSAAKGIGKMLTE